MSSNLDHLGHIKHQIKTLSLLGVDTPKTFQRKVLLGAFNFFVNIMFLISISLAPIFAESMFELSLGFSCSVLILCVFARTVLLIVNGRNLKACVTPILYLNKRAKSSKEETEIIADRTELCNKIFRFLLTFDFIVVGFFEFVMTFILPERYLMIPSAWMPFDYQKSAGLYYFTNFLFYILYCYQTYMGSIVDTVPGVTFLLLSAHFKIVSERIAKIGWDAKKTLDQNYKEFVDCIKDHQAILE